MLDISDQENLRKHLIELLVLPRDLMQDKIDIPNCPHSGFYNALAHDCINCIKDEECKWLMSNDEFVAMNEKSINKLLSALKFSVEFVETQVLVWGHKINSCQCKVCAWLDEAKQAMEKC